ncbi:MAG: T9SS type A sorting domain-containing protein [Ignavibacteria bacterium]|nr:T9SS type A sorting domain-containing protein [Ignavibacteria bacterium]
MKKLILLILLCTCIPTFAQSQFETHTLTSGHVDKNPVFASSYYPAQWILLNMELLAFERHSGSNSQICVIQMGPNGMLGQITQITNAASLKRNPAIDYNSLYGHSGSVTHALAVWEDYRNSKWDLYASSFSTSWGWSVPYAFDTDQYNKSNVKIIGRDSAIFYIVYEKNNDIIYRKFNSRTNTVLDEVNLTSSDPAVCGKPVIVNRDFPTGGSFIVSYEKTKADTKKAVYFRKRNNSGVWETPDTAAYAGNNMNTGFAASSWILPEMVFDSDRSGKYKMYATVLNTNGTKDQYLVQNIQQYSYCNYNHFQSFFYPIITDTYFMVASYIRKSDVTKLFCQKYTPADSTLLGDSSLNVKSSMNNGIATGNIAVIWIAYTKDSLSFSNVYAKRTWIIFSGVKNLGTGVPEGYSLYQNYPNPFNPSTVIKFAVPKAGDVRLRVFDALGREVVTLVNEHLSAGTYEVAFNASGYASSVYFYRLHAGDYAETKRMVHVK